MVFLKKQKKRHRIALTETGEALTGEFQPDFEMFFHFVGKDDLADFVCKLSKLRQAVV